MIEWTPASEDFDDLWSVYADDVPDMLATMFAHQESQLLQYTASDPKEYLDPDLWGVLENRNTQAAIRENSGYVVEELMEAVGLLKNKPWRKSNLDVDKFAYIEELADVWHFLIQTMIISGFTPLDIFQAYFEKASINERRRESGY